MNKKILGTLLLTLFFSSNSFATDVDQYDKMAQMLSKQLHASLKVMNDPELIKENANYIKNLYDALIEEGFNKEQALKLVAATLASKK